MREPSCEMAEVQHRRAYTTPCPINELDGPRHVLRFGQEGYPQALVDTPDPPHTLYVVGDPAILEGGLAVIGARKATPYGLACAHRFAGMAAEKNIVILSGGALGCDSRAHRAALDAHGKTVAVLGGGCNRLYPRRNRALFQQIVDAGGAVISEHEWNFPPLPYTFRARNRIIAGLSKAVLIVEAGLPSGTFTTADDALDANRDVLVVPGCIASPTSAGANRLLYQGAHPVVDDETFEDTLFSLFGTLKSSNERSPGTADDPLLAALLAQPMRIDEVLSLPMFSGRGDARESVLQKLVEWEVEGLVERYPDGRYGCANV